MPDDDGSQSDAQASVTITQSDEYYLKVEHISGRGHARSVPAGYRRRGHGSAADHVDQQASGGRWYAWGWFSNPITVSFSEDLQTVGGQRVSTWDLRAAGEDGLFDTADDELYTLSPFGRFPVGEPDGDRWSAATGRVSVHGLRARDCWTGSATCLDGNGDGTGGDDLVRSVFGGVRDGYGIGESQQQQHSGGDAVAAVRGSCG